MIAQYDFWIKCIYYLCIYASECIFSYTTIVKSQSGTLKPSEMSEIFDVPSECLKPKHLKWEKYWKCSQWRIGGGGGQGMRAPSQSFFHFHAAFGKFYVWIRHSFCTCPCFNPPPTVSYRCNYTTHIPLTMNK